MTPAQYLDFIYHDPIVYRLACCALALCVWTFGYWVGTARGMYIERQRRETVVEFQADTVYVCTHGTRPIITPLRTVRGDNATPNAFADFGDN